jgi:hypothetical protein
MEYFLARFRQLKEPIADLPSTERWTNELKAYQRRYCCDCHAPFDLEAPVLFDSKLQQELVPGDVVYRHVQALDKKRSVPKVQF